MSGTVVNSGGNLRIEEVPADTPSTSNVEPVVEIEAPDKELVAAYNNLAVTPSVLDRASGIIPAKAENVFHEICALATSVVKVPLLSDQAVSTLCVWAARQLWEQGKKVSVSSVTSFLKSGSGMVKAKIKSMGKKKGGSTTRAGVQTTAMVPATPRAASQSNGAVSITAPVSTGNVLSGRRTISRTVRRGHIVSGREFLMSAYGSGSITSWTMVAGMPLTPVAFVDSMLRMYGSMYTFFRWKRLVAHYVTTSPTSSSGSVMFYYNKDRASVFLEQTSTNLLPFVLSDPHTTISPQWQNFSVELETSQELMRCDYGMTDDSTHYAAGELFLLSRTTTTDSPGVLLLDYEIEFSEQNLTPRLLLWPQPTIAFVPYTFALPVASLGGSVGMQLIGGTTSNPFRPANTNVLVPGGIYKVIIDVTNSKFGGSTPASTPNTVWTYKTGTSKLGLILKDGSSIYACNGASNVQFYENVADAYTNMDSLFWAQAFTAGGGDYFLMWFSLVGFQGPSGTSSSM